ncbi:sister chromatid cohesion protein DCC1 [Kwoniella mangroviensis CBS 10435]|uniref:Sister chromatid cohesion protein DCC1 n=1 Tax=Kwoniella mangroviensis CBS 10435 TaxID=1331196 RepID=A0A1B9IN93_9TREE|nr:sister chromatid cohesion protein DCC1 [Kwoniella mangroviensis CBS 10435]
MPVGSNLPLRSVILRYPPSTIEESEESYQLLELPPEIIKAVEASKGKDKESIFPLTIKGKPSDDAVLCTPNSTFQLRTVGISNSILVCRSPHSSSSTSTEGGEKDTLQIRDTCHEILECVAISPNLERIRTILKDSAWKGINSSTNNSLGKRKRGEKENKVKKWTRDQLSSVIQCSEEELDKGLKERNVIEVNGKMLLPPPKELKELLSIMLSLLTIHSLDPTNSTIALSQPMLEALQDDHEVDPSITKEVLTLFGELVKEDGKEEEMWKADIKRIIREIGKGLLVGVKDKKLDEFEDEWRNEVGEEWGDEIDIKLLEGEYLLSPKPLTTSTTFSSSSSLISHFPISSLPLQPSERFSDLFLTRPKWRPEEILPFLKGLTRDGDVKSRDKLVQKFVRVVKEKDGSMWWYPRRSS